MDQRWVAIFLEGDRPPRTAPVNRLTGGPTPVFWGVLAGVCLAAAAGVASRRRWGRALAAIVAAAQVTLAGASLAAALVRADLATIPGGLVEGGLAVVVLYAVLRQWPRGAVGS